MGYTPDLVTGVWVGNADYTPMVSSSGLSGAAPVWSQFMEFAVPYVTNGVPTPFVRPDGIVDKIVCRLSGTEPSSFCGTQYTEIFAFDQLPLPPSQDLARRINIDIWTGYQASEACDGPSKEDTVLNVADQWARQWFETGDGKAWLEDNNLPGIHPTRLSAIAGRAILNPLLKSISRRVRLFHLHPLKSKALPTPMKDSKNGYWNMVREKIPVRRTLLGEGNNPVKDGTFTTWSLSNVPNGIVTLRLTLIGEKAEVDKRIRLNLSLPTSHRASAYADRELLLQPVSRQRLQLPRWLLFQQIHPPWRQRRLPLQLHSANCQRRKVPE